MNKGEYDLCAVEETAAPNPVPAPVPVPTVTIIEPGVDEDGGIAGWAIALIIILCLSLICCGGYAIAVMCFGVTNCFKDPDDDGPKKIHNDLYLEDNRHNHLPLDYEKRLAIMDGGRSEADDRPRLAIMDGSVASRSRATSYNFTHRSGGPSLQRTYADDDHQISIRSQDPSFATLSTYGSKRRQSRDPTMYITGQDGRIDPGMSVNSFRTRGGESGRFYSDEPQMKPKREPTMYVDGKATGNFQRRSICMTRLQRVRKASRILSCMKMSIRWKKIATSTIFTSAMEWEDPIEIWSMNDRSQTLRISPQQTLNTRVIINTIARRMERWRAVELKNRVRVYRLQNRRNRK